MPSHGDLDGATGNKQGILLASCTRWLRRGLGEVQRLMQPVMRPDGLKRLTVMMALLAMGTPQAYGFKIYDLNYQSQPMEIHSQQNLEPCPGFILNHVAERTSQRNVTKMKEEEKIRVTCCRAVKSIFSQYCAEQGQGASWDT
jgi:hypothetical protein